MKPCTVCIICTPCLHMLSLGLSASAHHLARLTIAGMLDSLGLCRHISQGAGRQREWRGTFWVWTGKAVNDSWAVRSSGEGHELENLLDKSHVKGSFRVQTSRLSLLLAADGQHLCSRFPSVIRVSEEMCHVQAVKSLKRIHTLTLAGGHPTQSVHWIPPVKHCILLESSVPLTNRGQVGCCQMGCNLSIVALVPWKHIAGTQRETWACF